MILTNILVLLKRLMGVWLQPATLSPHLNLTRYIVAATRRFFVSMDRNVYLRPVASGTTMFGTIDMVISDLGRLLRDFQSSAPQGGRLAECYTVRFDILVCHIFYNLTLAPTFQDLMGPVDANAAKKTADSADCMTPVWSNPIRSLNHSIDLVNNIFSRLLQASDVEDKLSAIDGYVTVRQNKIHKCNSG